MTGINAKKISELPENKSLKSSETPKIEENLYQKTLFVFNVFQVFIAYLPELEGVYMRFHFGRNEIFSCPCLVNFL